MNFTLAREIYGTPWFMDSVSIHRMSAIMDHIRNGGSVDQGGVKNNQSFLYNVKSDEKINSDDYNSNEDSGLELISLLKFDGPITKHGGMSSFGTVEMAEKLLEYDKKDNIVGHIIWAESGGGSSIAVKYMTEAMEKATKPIVVFAEDLMASAMMYIASYADYIVSHRDTDMIGSIGTMIEFAGYPKISEDKNDGFRFIRVYADEATEKNKEFEEAINNLNFQPIIQNILNPHNDQFKKDMQSNRPNIRKEELTGKIFNASDVVGTLIDEIGSFQVAVNKVLELSKSNKSSKSNLNKSNMNKTEVKASYPAAYNEIMAEGASQERLRVQAWMAFNDVDPEAVKKGIETGAEVNNLVIAEMARTSMANIKLEALKTDSQGDVKTKKEEVKDEPSAEVANFEKEVMASTGLKVEEVK